MNYLLFVYYDNTVENPESTTNQIGLQIADQMSSKEVKFIYGDKHGIFHFASELSIEELTDWVDIINEDVNCFQYFLTPKPRNCSSNMPQDNLDHLLSLRKTKTKKHKPTPPKINYDFKASSESSSFMDIADLLLNFKRKEVCNLTLDELLDKIASQGLNSLTEVEKLKLDEYSKSL